MKKIVTLVFLAVTGITAAQTSWPNSENLMLPGGKNALLGLRNNRSLNISTNDSVRVIIDSLGKIKIPGFAFEPSVVGEIRQVYINQYGYLSKIGDSSPGVAGVVCGTGQTPWKLGGNTVSGLLNSNLIGPCNADFVLQGNGVKSLFLTADGRVGVGEGNLPAGAGAVLDISDPVTPGNPSTTRDHMKIFGDYEGRVATSHNMNLMYNGDFSITEGNTVGTNERFTINQSTGLVSIWNNASIGGNSSVMGNSSTSGNSTTGGNSLVSGKIGAGTSSPLGRIHAFDLNNCSIIAQTNSGPAGIWAINGSNSYGLHTSVDGIGHLVTDIVSANPTNILNFSAGHVWINSRPTSAHTDYAFAVGGKIVAQSIYVTLNCTWADYVFDKNYKLPKLSDVESYYKANKHLPEIPTAKEVEEMGIDVAGMNTLLLKKVEELTIYMVELNKKVESLEAENKMLTGKGNHK